MSALTHYESDAALVVKFLSFLVCFFPPFKSPDCSKWFSTLTRALWRNLRWSGSGSLLQIPADAVQLWLFLLNVLQLRGPTLNWNYVMWSKLQQNTAARADISIYTIYMKALLRWIIFRLLNSLKCLNAQSWDWKSNHLNYLYNYVNMWIMLSPS